MAEGVLCQSGATDTGVEYVEVFEGSGVNLSSIFECEYGEFDVTWEGSVTIRDPIRIGYGTVVSIHGDYDNGLGSSDTASGHTASSVGEGSEIIAEAPFGSMFYVTNGSLSIENVALRNGNATNSTSPGFFSGGGIQVLDGNLTVSGCEFENTFAEYWGGGIFVNRSRIVVRDTVFRECKAGNKPQVGDEDAESAGGGVGVSRTCFHNLRELPVRVSSV